MTDAWRHEYVFSSVERELGRTKELAAAIHRGQVVRVARGVYRLASARVRDPERRGDDDFLARIRAAHIVAPVPPVFAGMAAAAVWGLPVVGSWPERVTVLCDREAGGRSNRHLARTYVGYPAEVVERGGLRVTTLARTIADIARTERVECAVAMADRALRGTPGRAGWAPVTRAEIAGQLDALGRVPGVAAARAVLAFASGRSDSPGESVSRVVIRRLGLTAPRLQHRFHDADGLVGVVDFWWPQFDVIGEFDGIAKYVRSEFMGDSGAADVVVAEKQREDRLRALGPRVVRWGWRELSDLRELESRLRAAGVR